MLIVLIVTSVPNACCAQGGPTSIERRCKSRVPRKKRRRFATPPEREVGYRSLMPLFVSY